MADQWAQFQPADQWASFQPATSLPLVAPKSSANEAPFTWEGLGKSVATGVGQGTAGVLGLPGDIGRAELAGVKWLGNKAGLPEVGNVTDFISNYSPVPSSGTLNAVISAPTGGYHQPQNIYEDYGQTAGQFAPAFFGGEGSVATRLGRVLAPSLASETAGQIAKGTPYENAARLGGALLGSFASPASFTVASPKVPSLAELTKLKDAAYDTVDNSGMMIAQPSLKVMADTTKQQLVNLGIDPGLQPNAFRAFERLQDAAKNNHTLKGMDILSRIARNGQQIAGRSGNDSDMMMSGVIRRNINDYINNLGPQDVIGGNVDQQAINALNTARNLNRRVAASEDLEDLVGKAQTKSAFSQATSSGQAIRGKFGNLYMNDNAMAGFTPDERAAIYKVAKGTPVERIARVVGKLSPDHAVPLIAGLMEAGPAVLEGNYGKAAGVGAILGAGTAGKVISNAITAKNARLAAELIRAGGTNTAQSLPATTTSMVTPALAAYLSQIHGQQQAGSQ